MEGQVCEDRGRDWSDVAMSQGMPGTTEEERVKEVPRRVFLFMRFEPLLLEFLGTLLLQQYLT